MADDPNRRGPNAQTATPPVDPTLEYLPPCNWTLFRSLPTFDIRNGDISDVTSVFIKASIGTPYHWVPIQDLAPVDAIRGVDGFIKSHLAYLAVNRPPNMTDAQAKKAAICLGTARAVSTTFYRITPEDLIPGERAQPMLIAARSDDGSISFRARAGVAAPALAILNSALQLDETEQSVVCALVKCSAGIIPMQGYSLIMTNHHYLPQSDSQAKRVYGVVEKAHWKSVDIANWFNTDLALVQDCLWHKACHPVSIRIKTDTAMDPTVPPKLVSAGAGACASRLPAIESELRAANSFITLLATVNPMFEICKGKINFGNLVDMTEIVKSFPPGIANPAMPPMFPAALQNIVTNRTSALEYLGGMLKRNQDMVAYCYGFYVALSESNLIMGAQSGATADTLKTSFSLVKLRNQSFASFTSGYQAYGDYQAVRNAMRARGEFTAPTFDIL